MREIPILFSAPMVRAILEGRKTQTRRVVKPQPLEGYDRNEWYSPGVMGWTPEVVPAGKWQTVRCPYGQPGDRLWVRETHALEHCVDGNEPPYSDGRPVRREPDDPRWTQAHYRATDPAPDLCCERENCAQCRDHDMGPHWRPSIHMPRWASRITLEVTGVRVERLQDISEADAIAEGLHQIEVGSGYRDRFSAKPVTWAEVVEQEANAYEAPRLAYRDLWESINGTGNWDANPWVWVVEFRRVEVPHG